MAKTSSSISPPSSTTTSLVKIFDLLFLGKLISKLMQVELHKLLVSNVWAN